MLKVENGLMFNKQHIEVNLEMGPGVAVMHHLFLAFILEHANAVLEKQDLIIWHSSKTTLSTSMVDMWLQMVP